MENLATQFEQFASMAERGHIILIKFDGERETDKISCVLSLLEDGQRQVIQNHGDDLAMVLEKSLKEYDKHLNR